MSRSCRPIGERWTGKILIDTTNPIEAPTFVPFDVGGLREGGRLYQFPGGPLAGRDLIQL
ncbi:hypothetical protein ASF06_03045 [Agreia sp. Leaf244]|nr:hypothetical protein ASF06_03045 [Agreia sp. Leaf244]